MAAVKECTQCGACLDTCPVFNLRKGEEYSPKAKHQLMRKGWTDDGELDWKRMMELAGQCACCERCKPACARRLSVPEALSAARARYPLWQQYFWREWIRRGGFLWKVAAGAAPLAPAALLPRKLGMLHKAALAMRNPEPVQPWLRLDPLSPQTAAGGSYAIFGGCTATRLRPQWVHKAARTITRLGGAVIDAEGFTCCGGTYGHAGMLESARKAQECNVEHWRSLGRPRIAVFCASCLHSLRAYAEGDAAADAFWEEGEAQTWLAALTPLSSLLLEAQTSLTATAPAACGYHSPCHWGKRDDDFIWLSKVLPGLTRGKSLCCGFGGVLKMLDPELSGQLADACWAGFEAPEQGTLYVLTGCSGCVLQLTASAPENARVLHWLDIWQP